METFLKRSGIGAIVIITSPFWLAMFLLYVVFGTLMIILAPLRGLFGLFSSNKGTFKIKNHYDVEAAKLIAESGPGNISGPINQVPTYIYANNPNNNNNNNNSYPTNSQQNYSNQNINNLPQNNNQNQQNYNNNNQQNYNNSQQNYNNNQSNNYNSNNYPDDNGQNGGCC